MPDYSKMSNEELQQQYSIYVTEWEHAKEEVSMLDDMLQEMEEELLNRGLQ